MPRQNRGEVWFVDLGRVAKVRPCLDFLIIVNPNRSKTPIAAPYINGLFMETVRDHEGGYTRQGLMEIENTLLWAEENLRSPQVNCLEGWGVRTQPPDSPTNLRLMRVFTTMSLTHSDGYVLYITGIRFTTHKHDWRVFEITHNTGEPSHLTDDGVRKIIKSCAAWVGLKDRISGHSLRIGTAVALAQSGASLVDIQTAGRWKDPSMPAHYARAQFAERGAIARFKDGKK